ncbi:hypothetical protein SDRG_05864 [Saprolegnia diclina VS20]|uniref:acylphosphatase n=1 Tax=Saprolegnia diclina (strain VS20) TaxID=1156394 RepID=T0S0Y8_SAPDV|nr:hypothetical protein SDRG_05864 [Saprolegnia diclina VS20]EQC36407.1 hypothetical protein SDRG_05864 [Saprolegnia diclina VS20]|eukprot:XP_008609828.1 hypothetical protein SDRG_05864 [Saprolegnia diclina VS20]
MVLLPSGAAVSVIRSHRLLYPETMVVVHAKATGNVQQVMFRQTIIRAMTKRGITGGATNLKTPARDTVEMTLDGDAATIQTFLDALRTTQPLNSWGARVDALVVLPTGRAVQEHQVTTTNVDERNWNPNVEFYI